MSALPDGIRKYLLVCLSIAFAFALPAWGAGDPATAAKTPSAPDTQPAGGQATRPSRRLPPAPIDADDSPQEAQSYFLSKRLAPGMTGYPTERLLQAQRDALKLPLYSTPAHNFVSAPEGSLAAEALTWTALGPGNVGGRTRAFKFVPGSSTTIYAAGVAGGVWKSTNTGGSWSALGDAMANMAVTALLIDPSNTMVIYAGTGEGYFNSDRVQGAGIFKSIDGGVTWSQLSATNNSNFSFINDLVFDPGNSAIIYAATGNGLYRSIDSGTSWTQMINASNSNGCMKVVYRSDVDTAIASCGTFAPTATSNGIWQSTNASVASPTWTHVVGPTGSGATQTLANMGRISLAIAPSNQLIVYALIACRAATVNACGTNNAYNDGLLAVYQSTDGGATWSSKYTSTLSTTSVANADLLLTNPIFARFVPCFGSGSNSFLNQGWYDNVIAVDPLDSARVWVGGIDLWRSDDSGATWGVASYWWVTPGTDPEYVHADQHGIVFDPGFNGTTNAIVYATDDGGLWKSVDARAAVGTNGTNTSANSLCDNTVPAIAWTNLNNGYGVTQYYHGTVYPSGTQYFAGAQDNGTTRGTDGSPNAWTTILGGDGGWTAIDKNTSGSGTVLYAENTRISVSKSANNGGSFANAITGISGATCGLFINPFQMDPNNTQELFTSSNVLWRTSNAAVSWTQASAAVLGAACGGETFSNYAIAPGNSDLLVAGTNQGHICRLVNATSSTSATSVQDCTQPAGSFTFVSEIAFDPNNATKVYAAVSTFGVGHVWKSVNFGQTWTNISGSGGNALPDSPTHTVAVSPLDPNTIYAGTEIGVFVTTDGGTNWARENTGFANVITDHLVFSPTGGTGQTLYAFTHGRGVFRASVSGGLPASATVLGSAPGPSVFGQAVTLTATVSGGSGTPTGTADFYEGVSPLATGVALNGSGVATFITSTLSVGTHNFTAQYSGSGTYNASAGNHSQTVNKAATTLSIADSPDPTLVGANVTITPTLNVTAPGAGTPTGTITVTGSNTTGCTITLPATSCPLSFSASGAQTIDASYGGDANFAASSATQIGHTVTPTVDLSISNSDNSPDAKLATQVTYTIVVSNAGPSTATGATVAVAIPAGLSNAAWTCTPTPPAACPHASGSGAISETVTLASGQTLTYQFKGTVTGSVGAMLTTTATIAAPLGTTDTSLANNTAVDIDDIIDEIFKGTFDP